MSHAGSLSSSGSEFQTVGPATGKARRQYVLSRQRGTISRCRLAERSRCRNATSMAGLIWSARYRSRCLSVQTTVRHEAELEDDSLRHIQPVQFVMKESWQTTIKFLRVADYSSGGVEHSKHFCRLGPHSDTTGTLRSLAVARIADRVSCQWPSKSSKVNNFHLIWQNVYDTSYQWLLIY